MVAVSICYLSMKSSNYFLPSLIWWVINQHPVIVLFWRQSLPLLAHLPSAFLLLESFTPRAYENTLPAEAAFSQTEERRTLALPGHSHLQPFRVGDVHPVLQFRRQGLGAVRGPDRGQELSDCRALPSSLPSKLLLWQDLANHATGMISVPATASEVAMHVCVLSRGWLFVTPWTAAHQAPWSMGFSRQEYWSGLPFPSPEDLPNPRIEPASEGGFLTTEPAGKPVRMKK